MGDPQEPETAPVPTDEAPNSPQVDEEVGDFISGHVLEKDTVFFEG